MKKEKWFGVFLLVKKERERKRDSDADVKFLLSFIKILIFEWVCFLHILFYIFGKGKKLGLHEKQRLCVVSSCLAYA